MLLSLTLVRLLLLLVTWCTNWKMQLKFHKEKNYIGCNKKQHKYTKWIVKYYHTINYTSFKHDLHYYLMKAERNYLVRLVMKLMYDLVFVVLGAIRCTKSGRLDGIIIVLILYLCLLVSTPWYLWVTRNESINLCK